MERTWTCQRQTNGIVCKAVNPKRRMICQSCGKRRPPTSKPAHLAVMDSVTYEDLVAVMGERCWICGAERQEGHIKLSRDHAHEGDGTMRGLLDWLCNTNLPKHVTPEWLRAAATYMERGDWQHPDWDGPLGLMGRASKGSNAEHCAYAGCGLWVAGGADWCSAGHAQVADPASLASDMPF